MEKPNFRKMKRPELKKISEGGYYTNPRHTTAAKVELDRRNTNLVYAGVFFSFISAVYIFWQIFHDTTQDTMQVPSNKNIPNLEDQIKKKPEQDKDINDKPGIKI